MHLSPTSKLGYLSFKEGQFCNRIEIAVDRYHESSKKSAACEQRATGTRPVLKVIEHVPLPSNGNNFSC